MKKIYVLALAFILFANINVFAQKKVAVTSFYVTKQIGFEALGGGAGLAAAIGNLSDDPNFNLQPVLDNFYKTFTTEYAQNFPFQLMPEEEVVKRTEYVSYQGRFNEGKDADAGKLMQRFLTPEGYKPLQESLIKGEESNQMQMVKMFNDADGVMFVSMGYDFVKKTVPFTAGVRAYVRISLYNKAGKKVFTVTEYGTSKESVAIVGGIPIMTPAKLLPLCESASEKLVADLAKKMKKIAAKSAAKL